MRVILWGPGQMGIGALRALIQHPGLELAGLVVHSEAKEGRDAGDLCGLPATGIIATRDIDAALALDADAVAYYASGDYRYREAVDDIARCLRAGKNVVTTSIVPFCHPPAAEPDVREMLEQRVPGRRHDAVQQRRRAGLDQRHGAVRVQRDVRAHRQDHDAGDPRLRADRAARHHVRLHGLRASTRLRHAAAGAGAAQQPLVAGRLGPRRRARARSSTGRGHAREVDRARVVRDRVGSTAGGHRRARCGSGWSG